MFCDLARLFDLPLSVIGRQCSVIVAHSFDLPLGVTGGPIGGLCSVIWDPSFVFLCFQLILPFRVYCLNLGQVCYEVIQS